MTRLIAILFFLAPLGLSAQTVSDTSHGYTLYKDARLDLLMKKQVELNKEVYFENRKSGPGYRVLVISTNDRNKATAVKTRLMQEFSDQKTYLGYQSPYYKVQIGNFKTQPEANAYRAKILRIYPDDVIVVPATIEMKSEKDDATGVHQSP
jgi:SPOR domain